MSDTYDQLIQSKVIPIKTHGFEPDAFKAPLFDFQQIAVRFALRQGRAALFEECGLGKTIQQLEWARQVEDRTCKPVIILAPLAVAAQTIAEGKHFGIEVKHARELEDIGSRGIYITNYDRVDKFEGVFSELGGVVLDESSILKNFTGKTRIRLTELCARVPFRLCCTATPAPNDWMELGQHAEFLGVMNSNEMLSRWFINDTMNFGTYRLKGHARDDFWRWVATWAACIFKPSDVGCDDRNFTLPALDIIEERFEVPTEIDTDATSGELFTMDTVNATNIFRAARKTLKDRVDWVAKKVAEEPEKPFLIFVETNEEADELVNSLPSTEWIGAPETVEVRGAERPENKESKLLHFTEGRARIMVTKTEIAGFGLNWQHCDRVIVFAPSFSFEQWYQGIRRCWRFGQKNEVKNWMLRGSNMDRVADVWAKKMAQFDEMKEEMRQASAHIRNQVDKQLTCNTSITGRSGEGWTVYNGDCVRVAKTLPDNSIHFSVYSPPFAELYIYSADVHDMGNCVDDDAFFEQYRHLVREKLRITKPGGLTAVHCKDLVDYKGRDGRAGIRDFPGRIIALHEEEGWKYHSRVTIWKDPVIEMQRTKSHGLLFKNLCTDSRVSRMGLPDYVVWFRKWPEGDGEDAVHHNYKLPWEYAGEKPPQKDPDNRGTNIRLWQKYASPVWDDIRQTEVLNGRIARADQDEKHICPLQLDVIERCLFLGSNPGDTVFSPFTGVGSEGYVSVKRGRKFIGSELKLEYWEHACDYLRIAEEDARDLFAGTTK